MGLGLALLYRWEVARQAAIAGQLADILRLPPEQFTAPSASAWALFLGHVLLITLMAAASLIDLDEKTIPGEITTPGTLLGLILAAALPMALLPHVSLSKTPPANGEQLTLPPQAHAALMPGVAAYAEPLTLSSPNPWPASLAARTWPGLAIAQACWWLWCFALAPRIWRGRRGFVYGIAIITRRVVRELLRPPLAVFAWPGAIAITLVWHFGNAAWQGLLTSLVGMIVTGGVVWVVRLVGSAAMGREAMGFGDVTLMMMIGTLVGWQAGVAIFFLAPLAGVVVAVAQFLLRRGDEIPYGPYLCLGTLVVMVRWAEVWNWMRPAFEMPWLVPGVLIVVFALMGVMLVGLRQLRAAFSGGDS
jgi:prepilin signal peptidase PulO-like enzyme (type II secretory pathway)